MANMKKTQFLISRRFCLIVNKTVLMDQERIKYQMKVSHNISFIKTQTKKQEKHH